MPNNFLINKAGYSRLCLSADLFQGKPNKRIIIRYTNTEYRLDTNNMLYLLKYLPVKDYLTICTLTENYMQPF